MVAGPLHLPTATWGGHMGQFLLSVLILSSSTPLGNSSLRPIDVMASRSAELFPELPRRDPSGLCQLNGRSNLLPHLDMVQ